MRNEFEVHNLENKALPFIFHFHQITSKETSYANWHSNVEILYFTKGEGEVICSSVGSSVGQGDIFVVNSNAIHSITTSSYLEYYCLIADFDFCRFNGIPTDKINYRQLVSSAEVAVLYQNVIDEYKSDIVFREAGIKTAVLNLMLCLTRDYTDRSTDLNNLSSEDENIRLAMGYIKANFNQHLTLEDISSEVGLSKYYFIRKFKSVTGTTPIAYINSVRCSNAKKLLQKNKYTIHEIAVECGFENDSYFSKTFRKINGCLPSEYTKEQYNVNTRQYY